MGEVNLEIERELFRQFIASNRIDRYLWHLENEKRRDRIFGDLRDTSYFNQKKITEVESEKEIFEFLRDRNIDKEIYLICSEEEIDGSLVHLSELDDQRYWSAEEILGYSRDQKVGFFKNHEWWFYILK